MKLIIDGATVELNYLPFEDPRGGAILQLLLGPSAGRDALHKKLAEGFKLRIDGVMEKAKVVDGRTEIRLLNATCLEAIDAARMLGCGVQEIHPYL